MTYWIAAGAVVVIVLPVAVLAYSWCRAASIADDTIDNWEIEFDGLHHSDIGERWN